MKTAIHHTTGRRFQVLRENIRRQFVRDEYCELLNEKTGKSEFYLQSAIGKYFQPVKP